MRLWKVLLILVVASATNASANDGARLIKYVRHDYDLQKYRAKDLADGSFNQQVNFIYAVLSRTDEEHSHQLGGELNNEVWIHDDGHTEAVVRVDRDEQGNKIEGTGALVTECMNMGSYNYFYPPEQPLGHFAGDIFPWLKLGNCENDPSSSDERVEAYILDLRDGVISVLGEDAEHSLTEQFKFKGKGQSETIALFLMAMELGEFDPEMLGEMSADNVELRDKFLSSMEIGLKELMKAPNKRLR